MFNAHTRKVAAKAARDALKSIESMGKVNLVCIGDPDASPRREWWFVAENTDSPEERHVVELTEDLTHVRVYRHFESLKIADD